MKTYYCWRCETEVPMLEEHEWEQIEPLIKGQAKILKKYREEHRCDIKTATENAFLPATEKYFHLTGY